MKQQAMSLKQLTLLTVAVFVGIQFVPVDLENPPVETPRVGPEPVMKMLRNSCFDCHSNESAWPWYAKVAPMSWLVARDVRNGRAAVNFSTWGRYPLRQQEELKEEIWKQVKFSNMPPPLYSLGHPDARVTTDHHRMIKKWCGLPLD